MNRRLFRTVAVLGGTAMLLTLGTGPALAREHKGGQDAGDNGNPRGGMFSGDSGFAVCMDGAANEPRCYVGYVDGKKTFVVGQGSDYNGNSIVEEVEIDPAKGDGSTQGTGRWEATKEGVRVRVFFVYLGVLDLTVTPAGPAAAAQSGLGCAGNRLVYNVASSSSAVYPSTGKGNLHVFGQDYALTASKSTGSCGALWLGPTTGGFFLAPPNTSGSIVPGS